MKIDTERLELVALLPQQLKLLTTNIEKLEEELDAKYKAEPMEGFFLDIVKGQVKATEKDSENYFWHSFWLLIRKSDRVIVGSADFKDIPNKDCEVEIGYGLGKDFEHNGYMTEAVMAMTQWALKQDGVLSVIAETELDGFASQRILKRCGFKKYKEEAATWWRLRCC